ncbi:uncharacterized protein LOC129786406 [Lutzomyia longipalpis]|uniref:uncharacterized protein LOC129786406 n=1 Tax=Lutzomyia longipalpis TaxID=7200 RepID=UPI0024843054|nr:uncharacterized protein LOC129786406 [Lutzomyia longipalpis]
MESGKKELLSPKSPKKEMKEWRLGLQTPQIHTPRFHLRELEDSFSNADEPTYDQLKILYEEKCKEAEELGEFNKVEDFVYEKEIIELKEEVEKSRKIQLEMQMACDRAKREKDECLSNVAGMEMQLSRLKEKMAIREQELLSRIESAGSRDAVNAQEAMKELQRENDQLRNEIESERMARGEEIKKMEKMLVDLRDEINQCEKSKHDRETELLREINTLKEGTETSEKLSAMQTELDSMRETILELQKTISTLEEENKELSLMIPEAPSLQGDTLVDMELTQIPGDNMSLMEMDQTLLCELVGGAKSSSDSYSAQQRTFAASIEILRKENTNLVEENEKLSGQLLENVQEVDELRSRELEYLKKIQQQQEAYKKLEIAHRAIEDALADAEASICVLQREKDALVDGETTKHTTWNVQREKFEQKITFYAEKSTRDDEKIMELNKTIGDLVLQKAELEERCEASQTELSTKIELTTELELMTQKYAAAVKESSENRTKIAELDKLQQENASLTIQVDNLLFEVETLREKQSSDYILFQERETVIDQQKNLIKELEEEVKSAKVNVERSSQQHNIEHQAEIASLKASHEESLAKLSSQHNLEHQAEIAALKASHEEALAKVNREKDSLKAELEKSTEEGEKISKDKEKFFTEKLNRCQEQIERYNTQIERLLEENTNLQAITKESQGNVKTIWELREQIAEYRDKEVQLNQEKNQLKCSHDEVMKQCAHLHEEIRGRNEKIGEMQKELMLRESEVEKFSNHLQQLQLKESETMKTIEVMQSEHETQVTDLRGIISTEIEEKRQLQLEKEQLNAINCELTNVTKELRRLLEGLKGDLERRELALQAQQESNKILQKEIDEIRIKHKEEMQMKTEKTSTEDSKYKCQVDQLREIVTSKNHAYEELTSSYKSIQQKFNALESDNEANIAEVENLRQKVTEMTNLQKEGERAKLELELELEERVSEVEELRKKLNEGDGSSALKEELELYRSQCDDLKMEVVSLKVALDEGKTDFGNLLEKMREKTAKIESLERTIKFHEEGTQAKADERKIAAWHAEKEEILNEYKAMKQKLEKKVKNLKDANDNLAGERDYYQLRAATTAEKEKEINLLKDSIKRKDKSIDKLTNMLKEQSTSRPGSTETGQKEKRKSDRHSIHDGNRSIDFSLEKDASTMTDPTDKMCQCEYLHSKVERLQREVSVLKYNLDTMKKHNPLHNEVQLLKMDILNKDVTISNLSLEVKNLEQELRRVMQEKKSVGRRVRDMCHIAVQTDELRAREEPVRELMGGREKENEAQNGILHPTEELQMLKEKYSNLKRAFFKMKAKYEES